MPPSRSTLSSLASVLTRGFALAGMAGVVALTLIDRGATRMYSTPWRWLLVFVLLGPLLELIRRAFSREEPLRLPPRRWTLLAGAAAFITLLSALASPHHDPSLRLAQLALSALATFFLAHDWLARDRAAHPLQLLRLGGSFFLVVAVTSLARWLLDDLIPTGAWRHFSSLIDYRNARPLGHSNYTAGLALLMLPVFGVLAVQARRLPRLGWSVAALLAVALLFSSGSRGGLLGLAALVGAALFHAQLNWKKILLALLAGAALLAGLAFVHPRTRAMLLTKALPTAPPNPSNIQRHAMLEAGLAMGRDRPLLGWGPGTTPLVYPRYRAQLDGGAENVLQLHSLPLQLWAELGAPGLACAAAFLTLLALAAVRLRTDPVAATASLALAGYLAFALTDFQLDVPVFAFALALATALLVAALPSPEVTPGTSPSSSRLLGFGAILGLMTPLLLSRTDPTPRYNSRALALAGTHDTAHAEAAISLLRESIRLNPAQEIAHFNLAWLLVTRDPAAAETHFLAAARLVPDKGGVYLGLALARLNQEKHDAASSAGIIRALTLECLNDPRFLSSPWWRVPALAALRSAVVTHVLHELAALRPRLAARGDSAYSVRELDYLAPLLAWLDGRASLGPVLAAAHTPERVSYFAARPARLDFSTGPVHAFHRERTGYPVLMRNLDLPAPVDVFEVQENAEVAGDLAFLFPSKGWLPSPLLLSVLDAPL